MADEQWQKVRKVLDAALQQAPEERQRYINRVCEYDKNLLTEVQSLLSSIDKFEDFMETPAVAQVADVIEPAKKMLESGTCLRHYEIIRQIGIGGIGEVYLARDKKLDRQVAVKVLNEKYSQDQSNLERFVREAKAASALNHPNILIIHEIGETGQSHYIVSEFIEGKTLREVLHESSLQLSETLDIAIQVVNALTAAHGAHLVHRDIKPENIMIRPDGYIKVLDFGLAKLVEQKNKSFLGLEEETPKQNQTAQGVILGTVNYMSPEQARAEEVDERTDIFSLGAVIYEMITGSTPFQSGSTSDTFANLINKEPTLLSCFATNVPDELQGIVSKMLRKDRGVRYQSMEDLLSDLKALKENLAFDETLERLPPTENGNSIRNLRDATGKANKSKVATQHSLSQRMTSHKPLAVLALAVLIIGVIGLGYYFLFARRTVSSASGKKTIAVLPIKPINSALRDEIYEIGIADSLIHKLSSIKGLIVRPLSATRKYADIEQDPLAAGREQQVDYVLASNYQLAGQKLRITAQLINVASGQIEETYKSEKDVGDVFAMQDGIAGDVANILLARFATTSSSPTVKRGTTNEEAYRLYLQGRSLTYNRTAADARKAIEYFGQAIRLDPNFARAYSGMANAYIASGNFGGGLPRVEYDKAKEAVTKALELDNNLAEGYAVLGESKFIYDWDFTGAEKDLLRAIELQPGTDLAHEQYASYLVARGRFDEAIAEVKSALEIDPNSLQYQVTFGRILYLARHYDEAILQLKRVVEVYKDAGPAYGWLWIALEMKGDDAQAYEWFIKLQKRTNPELIEVYEKAYETSGWPGVRQKILDLDKLSEQKPSGNYYRLARQCALLGDKEQAFEYLNKAIEKRHGQLIMLNVEPAFDLLHSDPRFDELVRQVGLK